MSSSEKLDLSRLPAFELVEVDFEQMLADTRSSFEARWAALREQHPELPQISLGTTVHNPIVLLLEEATHSRMLDLQALNDAGKRLTVAFGFNGSLDHLAATLYADVGIRRLEGESDDRFRRRIALAPEARSPFTPGAYVYAALSASLDIADAAALNEASGAVGAGEVALILRGWQGRDDGELVDLVNAALAARPIRADTDQLTVRLATPHERSIGAVLSVRRGPDPAVVKAAALTSLAAYLAENRRIGQVVTMSGVTAALHVGGVQKVTLSFDVDLDPGPDGFVDIVEATVSTGGAA